MHTFIKNVKKIKYLLIVLILSSFIFVIPGLIDLNDLFDYENIETPTYISKNNTTSGNSITNPGATLGRVLFYDKNLSNDFTIACASCHLQEFAFGDTEVVSLGVNGVTGRHSMRLVNAKFSEETRAFWDERASTYEEQATMPIKDHVEMGFSGENGDPDFDFLIDRLSDIEYYTILFEFVYGDSEITEERMQKALTQFVKSITSYDSRYDVGREQVTNNNVDFPNFTNQENLGKDLFFTPPPAGGAGCFRCHSGSEFSIINDTNNNGVIGVAGNDIEIDLENTKAPTLRDIINPQGILNGPLMHDGSLNSLMAVIDHYNDLEETSENTNLDFRLQGTMHDLDLTQQQKDALVAFLETLTGIDVYTAEQWSDPFDENGELVIIEILEINENALDNLVLFPNPTSNSFSLNLPEGSYQLLLFDIHGKLIVNSIINQNHQENISYLKNGVYLLQVKNTITNKSFFKKLIKT